MDSNFSSRPQKLGSEHAPKGEGSVLVLHNDNINTFEFVMEALVEVCEHTETQAEQCAIIAHYKGKCEILSGEYTELREKRIELTSRGLKSTIE